jgi:hypothetical protein
VGAGGFFSVLLVLALLPFLEMCFSRFSNIRLLELSDVNHPLLKEMSLNAPGTYHHSLIVASLAQAAAERMGPTRSCAGSGPIFTTLANWRNRNILLKTKGRSETPTNFCRPTCPVLSFRLT